MIEVIVRIIKNIFLLSIFLILPFSALASELIIGTTFSEDATSHLINTWQQKAQQQGFSVRTLNRTSNSLKQLLATDRASDVDLIISSSPILFYTLQQQGQLAKLPDIPNRVTQFVPEMLQTTTIAFSLSGYGILSNTQILNNINAPVPLNWDDLITPNLHGQVIISSPTRSDTNHIMLEALLQQQGWDKGWALINQIAANVGTISSRSFGVVDKIQANLGAAGITIDNYANLLTQTANNDATLNHNKQQRLVFNYFPNFPVSPTFIAVTAKSNHHQEALQFIEFLLSNEGQKTLSDSETGKYPIYPLNKQHPFYQHQQYLFSQPQIDYSLMLKRQELVKLLFEHQITYRLNQLQENWQLLYAKEQQLNKQLPEIRQILNAIPVSEQQSMDENYLNNLNINQELLLWQSFFADQQLQLIKMLEALE